MSAVQQLLTVLAAHVQTKPAEFGSLRIRTDDATLRRHSRDKSYHHESQRPRAVVAVASEAHVALVLSLANALKVPVVAYAAGTSLEAQATLVSLLITMESLERSSEEPAPTNDEQADTKSTDISFQTPRQLPEGPSAKPAPEYPTNDEPAKNRTDMTSINPFNTLEIGTDSRPNKDPTHALLESFEEKAEDETVKSNLKSQESSAFNFQSLDQPSPSPDVQMETLETNFQDETEPVERHPEIMPDHDSEPTMMDYQDPLNCEFDSDIVSSAELLNEDVELLSTLEDHELSAIPSASWRELEEEMEAGNSASLIKDYMEGIEGAEGEREHRESSVSSVVQSSQASSIVPDLPTFVQPDNSSNEDVQQASPGYASPPYVHSEQEHHSSPTPSSPISQYSPKLSMNGPISPDRDVPAIKNPNQNATKFNQPASSPVRSTKTNNREPSPEVIEICSLHEIPAIPAKPKAKRTLPIHEWVQPHSQPHPHCTFRKYLPRYAPMSVRDQFCVLCGGDLCGPVFTGNDGYLQSNVTSEHKCIVDGNYKLVKVMLASVLACEECGSLVGEFGECVDEEGDDIESETRRVCRGYGKGERDADVRMLRARFLRSLYQERNKGSF
ncbi:hypothetical protein HDU81_006477 [Chytriomyces hyalinus]|nr:hypothetical protein HDU81_006477 [Chytriomyces hyalinus]